MIDYNEDRKEMQTERMIDDFIAQCEEEAARVGSYCRLLHRRVFCNDGKQG